MVKHTCFISLLILLPLTLRLEALYSCEMNIQQYPVHQNLIPEHLEKFTQFPGKEDYHNNSIIVNMFRQKGINRRCTTLDELGDEDCAETLDCYVYACFGYTPNAHKEEAHVADKEKLDPSTQFTVELYGYVNSTSPAWISVVFVSENNSANSLAFSCIRLRDHHIKLVVSVTLHDQLYHIDEPKFAKLVYGISDLQNPAMKNHVYCRIYVDQVISLHHENPFFHVDFTSSSFHYPVLFLGYHVFGNTGNSPRPDFYNGCWGSRPKYPTRIYRSNEPRVHHGWFTAFLHCFLVIIVLLVILYLIKVSNRRRFLKLRKVVKIIKEAKANN